MSDSGYNFKANTESVYAERALLVSVRFPQQTEFDHSAYEDEMAQLAKTAGLTCVLTVSQNLRKPNAATLIGKGKVEEINSEIKLRPEIDASHRDGSSNTSIDIVVFGCDLSPVQQRNLEKELNRRVIDRTELILDIFAQHAITRDGKIQVELAQLQYFKPRLTGRYNMLSRLGGGVGTRGPGETKLEVDRRKIEQRIRKLKKEYEKCKAIGKVQRNGRKREGAVSVALVGYTNAGKSTILNRLTKSKVTAKNQLFCTLDTTTRRLHLLDGTKLLVSDTVGFIEDLPPLLLDAFRATLAEVEEADILVHVVDAASPNAAKHIESVMGILKDMKIEEKPILTIFNKRDAVEDENSLLYLEGLVSPSITFSALQDKDFYPIMTKLQELLPTHKQSQTQQTFEEQLYSSIS